MIGRCERPNGDHSERYVGRGIYVCARWRGNYETFLADMGRKPTPRHSIDRINNDGSYTCGKCDDCVARGAPANCRWATQREQVRNSSKAIRWIEYQGKMWTADELGPQFGVNPNTLRGRIFSRGMSVELALSKPSPAAVERSPSRIVLAVEAL